MNFKDQYQKAFKTAAPSPQLQQETLELLQEARDHHIEPEQPVKRWKLAYTLSLASSVAAVFFCIVMVQFFSGDGKHFQDEMANEDWFSASDSLAESENDTADKVQGSDDQSDTSDQDFSDEDAKQESTEHEMQDGPSEDVAEDEGATPSKPKDPVLMNDVTTRSYQNFAALLQALTDKTAPGYGKNYYLARELLILPNRLPDGARFRSVDLSIADGGYSYSYLLKENGAEYFLTLTVSGTAPKTLTALTARKDALANEVISLEKSGNTRTYLFGETEKVTLVLQPVISTDPIPTEGDVDRILNVFALERCSLTNPTLEMTY